MAALTEFLFAYTEKNVTHYRYHGILILVHYRNMYDLACIYVYIVFGYYGFHFNIPS